MTPRILLTTTSFQDTPGPHHATLAATGWEIVTARGPLSEADTLALVGEIDGYLCGDDAITRQVIEKATPRLKVLSKYGIGVDKIDVAACTRAGIAVVKAAAPQGLPRRSHHPVARKRDSCAKVPEPAQRRASCLTQ